ncbi:DNA/RNA polymerase, partial [Ascobolus immersus RN42]
EEHMDHLAQVLSLLATCNVAVNPNKCFFAFDSVKLLGRQVDKFRLATLAEKIQAIAAIYFPITLDELKHFLGLTGYYRQFVDKYTWKAGLLQHLKTEAYRYYGGTASLRSPTSAP